MSESDGDDGDSEDAFAPSVNNSSSPDTLKTQLTELLEPLIRKLNKNPLGDLPTFDINKVLDVVLSNEDSIKILAAIHNGDKQLKELLDKVNNSCFLPTRILCWTYHNSTITVSYISLRRGLNLMKNKTSFAIMIAIQILLHYPVNRRSKRQEQNRYGSGLAFTMKANERHLGYLCRDILTAFVEVKRLHNSTVRLLMPLTDAVPDARNPVLKKEPASQVAHFAKAIQLRVRTLESVLVLAHWL